MPAGLSNGDEPGLSTEPPPAAAAVNASRAQHGLQVKVIILIVCQSQATTTCLLLLLPLLLRLCRIGSLGRPGLGSGRDDAERPRGTLGPRRRARRLHNRLATRSSRRRRRIRLTTRHGRCSGSSRVIVWSRGTEEKGKDKFGEAI